MARRTSRSLGPERGPDSGDSGSAKTPLANLLVTLRAASARERVRLILDGSRSYTGDEPTAAGAIRFGATVSQRKVREWTYWSKRVERRLRIAVGDDATAVSRALGLYFEGRAVEAAAAFILLAERATDPGVRGRMTFFAQVNGGLIAPEVASTIRERLPARSTIERAWQEAAGAYDDFLWGRPRALGAYERYASGDLSGLDPAVVLSTVAMAGYLNARGAKKQRAIEHLTQLERRRREMPLESDVGMAMMASGLDFIIEWGAQRWIDGFLETPMLQQFRSLCAGGRKQGNAVQTVLAELELADFCVFRGRLIDARRLAQRAARLGRLRSLGFFETRAHAVLVAADAVARPQPDRPPPPVFVAERARTFALLAGRFEEAFAPKPRGDEPLISAIAQFLADPFHPPLTLGDLPDFADPVVAVCALIALGLGARDGADHGKSRRLLSRAVRIAQRHGLRALAEQLWVASKSNRGWLAPAIGCIALDGRTRFWSANDWVLGRESAQASGRTLIDTRQRAFRERSDLLRAIAWQPPGPVDALGVARTVWGGRCDTPSLLNRLHVTLHRLRQLGGPLKSLVVDRGRIAFDRNRIVVVAASPPRR